MMNAAIVSPGPVLGVALLFGAGVVPLDVVGLGGLLEEAGGVEFELEDAEPEEEPLPELSVLEELV